jgi:hypothetical protein
VTVAHLAIAMMNADITKRIAVLSDQISDKFNDSIEAETAIEFTESSRQDVEKMFRIKNLCMGVGTLRDYAQKVATMAVQIDKESETMPEEIYVHLQGSTALLLNEMKKMAELGGQITPTLVKCLGVSMKKGTVDLEAIEADAIASFHMKDDIRKYLRNIEISTGLTLGA